MQKLTNPQIALIAGVCMDTLESLKDTDKPQVMFHNPETKTLSWLMSTGKPILRIIAFKSLRKWIKESHNKSGKVFLYYCPDNAEIGLDLPEDDEIELVTKMATPHKFEDHPELNDILYLLKD